MQRVKVQRPQTSVQSTDRERKRLWLRLIRREDRLIRREDRLIRREDEA